MPVALGVLASVGCGDPEIMSDLHPEGPPEVLQMFVMTRSMDTMMPDYGLAFGYHGDWTGGFGVTNAVAAGDQKIRIILDELLIGTTLEQFQCACADPDAEGGPNCPGDIIYAVDDRVCPEHPTTPALEAGRWLDKNIDGVPDNAVMLPGVVTVDCDNGDWVNTIDDGWYNPSGNQFPGAGSPSPFEYLGPAIVVIPPVLPTNSTCVVVIDDSVTDKQNENIVLPTGPAGVDELGNAVMYDDALRFVTEPLLAVNASPAAGATMVDVNISPNVTLNVPVDPTSVTPANVTLETAAGVPVAGTVMLAGSGSDVTFDPAAALAPSTMYVLSITGVEDTYGVTPPQPITVPFTTGP